MLTQIQSDTAGRCARRLMTALQGGPREQIGSALDCIANLHSHVALETRESEFRDLLAGIVEQLTKPVPVQDAARRATALRMLAHVAATAG